MIAKIKMKIFWQIASTIYYFSQGIDEVISWCVHYKALNPRPPTRLAPGSASISTRELCGDLCLI